MRQEELQLLANATPRSEDIAASEAELEEAKQAWQLVVSGNRPEEIAAAKAAVAAAKAGLDAVAAQIQELEITAAVAGVVEAVELQKGDLVPAALPCFRSPIPAVCGCGPTYPKTGSAFGSTTKCP